MIPVLKHLHNLFICLAFSTKTNDKLDALKDKVWTIAMFSGRKPKRFVSPAQLQQWCTELTGLPQWLFNECYHTVGDLSETIALLLPSEMALTAVDGQAGSASGLTANEPEVVNESAPASTEAK